MRIGKTIIDTDSMTADKLQVIIKELRNIRNRKISMENYTIEMNNIIARAKEEGFIFVDKDCGYIREIDDFDVCDERI